VPKTLKSVGCAYNMYNIVLKMNKLTLTLHNSNWE